MEMILGKASKMDLIRSFNTLTLKKTVSGIYPTISHLKRQKGAEQTEKVLQIMIADLSASFGGALEEDDIEEIAISITTGILKNMTLEDVFIVSRDIKKSPSFGKMNLNKVMVALEDHLNKRIQLIADINHNEHLSTKFSADRNADKEKEKHREAKLWYINEKLNPPK